MATSETTIRFLLDQLSDLPGVRARKMFGEYALYCGEKVVALVCEDQLFVKITVPGKALVGERYAEGFAYPGAKASMLVGADELDDHERLTTLIRVTAAALPSPKPKKARTPQVRKKTGKKSNARRTKTRVEALRARGVTFEVFSGMNQNEQGVWQAPSGARVAWFKDPDGNVLSLTQL